MRELVTQRQTLPDFRGLINEILKNYRSAAARRGYEFTLSYDDFRRLILSNCHYCGSSPTMKYNGTKRKSNVDDFRYNGVDRVDNLLGYAIGNCVACCKDCNRSKGTLTQDEWLAWVKRLYEHQRLGEVPVRDVTTRTESAHGQPDP